MLGAHELEVLKAQILEEILHRLPLVKVLKVSQHFLLKICS